MNILQFFLGFTWLELDIVLGYIIFVIYTMVMENAKILNGWQLSAQTYRTSGR